MGSYYSFSLNGSWLVKAMPVCFEGLILLFYILPIWAQSDPLILQEVCTGEPNIQRPINKEQELPRGLQDEVRSYWPIYDK